MKYLLDTNICIAWLGGKDPKIRDRVVGSSREELAICSVVKAELVYGARKSQHREKNERRLKGFFENLQSLPFDDDAAEYYGTLRTLLEKLGTTIGANDLMIASIAQQHGLTIVTRNSREFEKIPTLKTENW